MEITFSIITWKSLFVKFKRLRIKLSFSKVFHWNKSCNSHHTQGTTHVLISITLYFELEMFAFNWRRMTFSINDYQEMELFSGSSTSYFQHSAAMKVIVFGLRWIAQSHCLFASSISISCLIVFSCFVRKNKTANITYRQLEIVNAEWWNLYHFEGHAIQTLIWFIWCNWISIIWIIYTVCKWGL